MLYLLLALIILTLIALIFGALLGYSSVRLKVESDPMSEKIDALLPQSQCGQCGYPGCKPYAEAITQGDAINKCVPGGQALVIEIAELLGVDPPKSDNQEEPTPKVALIHEDMCIGCTKCIQACPVDAIVGSNKSMHTVIPELCTGCELCVAPCPTDCITMEPIITSLNNWGWDHGRNKAHYQLDQSLLIDIKNIDTVQATQSSLEVKHDT